MGDPERQTVHITRWERLGPVLGWVSVALTIVAVALTADNRPEFMAPAAEVAAYYANDPTRLIVGFMIDAFATVFLLVFAAGVYTRVGPVRQGTLPSAVYAGAVGMGALFMVHDALNLAAAYRANEAAGISPELATALYDAGLIALYVGGTMFAGLFVTCTGLSAGGSAVLPRWLVWTSIILGAGLLLVPVVPVGSIVGLIAFLGWVVITGIVMFRAPTTADRTIM
jgi:hypothetical protein